VVLAVLVALTWEAFRPLSAQELMAKAQTLSESQKLSELRWAEDLLRELRGNYPDSPEARTALDMLGEISDRRSELRRVAGEKYFKQDIGPSELQEAAEILAKRHYDDALSLVEQGRIDAARIKLGALAELFPDTEHGKLAVEKLKELKAP
jgi:TolA-binding protein